MGRFWYIRRFARLQRLAVDAGDVAAALAARGLTHAIAVWRLLPIWGRNRRRSPTAEEIFAVAPGVEVCSAGVSRDADNPVTADLISWAEIVFVMEPKHRAKLNEMFSSGLKGKRVVCLNIPDDYEYMDAKLVQLLWARVPRSAPGLAATRPR